MGNAIALRQDLVIKEQTVSGTKSYVVKDPEKQSYYRFDEAEHFVLSLLDGQHDEQRIAALFNEEFKADLTRQDIQVFISSIKNMDLLEKSIAEQNTYLYEKLKEQRRSRILQAKGSAMYFRIPVWDPDQFFDRIMPYIKWIWDPWFVWLMNAFLLLGLLVLTQHQDAVVAGMRHVFDFLSHDLSSILLLWACVLGTIAIHELGHGLTCKRFGGECHEIGFLFMFFNPCMYANVNDAWLFGEKRHRLFVTFAGCYIELLTGVVALYVWLFTQPGSLPNIIAFQVVVVAFFSAIFMNFNPLMKFDGYFALSDFLEAPNLRSRSQSYVGYLLQTKLFRLDREFDYVTRREHWILLGYGSLMIIYMANVMLGISFMVGGLLSSTLGPRLGILFTIPIVYKFVGPLIKKFIGFVKVLMVEHKAFFARKSVRSAFAGTVTFVALVMIFYPFSYQLEFDSNLQPERKMMIRSLASGYAQSLKNPSQTSFKKGDVLLQLHNAQLDTQIENHALDIQMNKLQQKKALVEANTAALVQLQRQQHKLEEIALDLERQSKNLELRAPYEGVFEEELTLHENTFVSKGQVIGNYIDPQRYQATFSVLERDLDGINLETTASLSLNALPGVLYEGQVTHVAELPKMQGIARVYEVTVTFPNEDASLRSNLQGMVGLHLGSATVIERIVKWVHKTVRLDLQF